MRDAQHGDGKVTQKFLRQLEDMANPADDEEKSAADRKALLMDFMGGFSSI